MSNPNVRTDSVLRQPVIGPQVRRLSGSTVQSAHRVSTEAEKTEPLNALALLREQFAIELGVLRDEAHQQGLAIARQEAAVEIRAAKEEHVRQLQQKEDELRKAVQLEREQLTDLVASIRAHHEQIIPDLEAVVVRLALLVVAKLLGQHQVDRPLIADLAKHAIEAYRLGALMQIKVALVDYESIQAHAPADELLQYIQADHELAPGSCLIDYGCGQLDASLATQWAAIQATLLQSASGANRVAGA